MSNTRQALNAFFINVQKRALAHTEFAIGSRDDALDILQEAMIRLAKQYPDKESEWPMLFQRILYNLIIDTQRRKKVRRIMVWWQQHDGEESDDNEYPQAESLLNTELSPETKLSQRDIKNAIEKLLKKLPYRQQQAFTLRAWWGHDVKETAYIMKCSEGSVKTHYSRAINRLREGLIVHTEQELV